MEPAASPGTGTWRKQTQAGQRRSTRPARFRPRRLAGTFGMQWSGPGLARVASIILTRRAPSAPSLATEAPRDGGTARPLV
jgi:hypothetical protein